MKSVAKKKGKKEAKKPLGTSLRKHRMHCMLNDEELNIIEHYLKKYKIANKSRWIRETILKEIYQKAMEDYPTLFQEHEMRR
ncbi:MAG: hypothetical protein LBN06_11990 [Prevotellaceae bacterium]|jgi:hypothetical protein|nr:hypothetical protein [Prevotellaceae bacterium]